MSLCGARPFKSRQEIQQLLAGMTGTYRLRDRALVVLGVKTGLRISELLSLKIGDVLGEGDRFLNEVYVCRSAVKGKRAGRRLPLHPTAKFALGRWLVEQRKKGAVLERGHFLFVSRKGRGWRPISRRAALQVMERAAAGIGLDEGISTHSMRKWVAREVYQRSGNCLVRTGAVLGHRNISTTWRYCASLTTGAAGLLAAI